MWRQGHGCAFGVSRSPAALKCSPESLATLFSRGLAYQIRKYGGQKTAQGHSHHVYRKPKTGLVPS